MPQDPPLDPTNDLPDDFEPNASDDDPWQAELDAEVAAHDNLSPHPMRARIEKMFSGMDEIRAMYPTPEARAEAKIQEEGWLQMEALEAKMREAYPAFVAEDDAVIEHTRRENRSAEELARRRAAVDEAFAAMGILFN
jgi:hypothetical protein